MRGGGGERRDTDVGKGSLLEGKGRARPKEHFMIIKSQMWFTSVTQEGFLFRLQHLDIFLVNTT